MNKDLTLVRRDVHVNCVQWCLDVEYDKRGLIRVIRFVQLVDSSGDLNSSTSEL
jgi:hypothetical protein